MRKRRKWLATLMTIAMLVTMIPAGAFAQDGATEPIQVAWESSKSKTATNLDANHESEVTLSLPAADYEKSIDVVFVIDDTHAGSGIFAESAKGLVDSLAEQDNLDINLGIVTFDAVARDWLEVTSDQFEGLVSLKDEGAVEAIKNAIGTQLNYNGEDQEKKLGGSNTEWAVDMATEMLNNGSGSEKYMVMFSDMYGYVYRGDLTVDDVEYQDVPLSKRLANYTLGQLCISEPMYDTWSEVYAGQESDRANLDSFFRYKADGDPSAWNNYWTNYVGLTQVPDVDKAFAESISAPQYDEDLVTYRYFTPFEKSLCKTYDHLTKAIDSDINVAIVNNDFDPGTDTGETKPGTPGAKIQSIKNEMLNALQEAHALVIQETTGNGEQFSSGQMTKVFNTLKNELIQVVDEGSYVIDEIGSGSYTMGEDTYTYDFDFVNDIDKLTLTVGGQALEKEAIEPTDGATAAWKFGDSTKDDQFELYYYQKGATVEEQSYGECFVWKINVPIMKETPVQLTYSVELTEPRTEPGTHGQYDANGSKTYGGLFTNNSATLHPVDSLGNANYAPEKFQKPTVSYTVEEPIPEGTIRLQPADITIYTGGDGYESAVEGSGETEFGKVSDGLPEPGFYVTLPEDLNNWMIAHADVEDKTTVEVTNEDGTTRQTVVDLSDYLTFTYKDDQGNNRLWKLERYDDTDASDSMAFSKYIYRILPAKVGNEEIPIRLQFTDQDGDITTSDDFTINLNGLYQEYDMTIYPGALTQQDVKAVLTVGEDVSTNKTDVVSGELVVRGVVSNAEDPTTEITVTTPTKQVEDVTAQVPGGTIYKINESDLAVENQDAVRLLVDSVVPDSNNTLQKEAIEEFNDVLSPQHDCEMNYLDLVDTSNGNAWVTTGGTPITVHWPIPDDATDDSEFYIVHYEGLDRNDNDALGDGDYTQELYSVDKRNLTVDRETGNITFTVDSFSPFALFYTAEENDNPGGPVIPSDPDDPDPDTPDLNTDDHYSYIVGYPEDYRTGEATDDESLWPVKPQGNITRAEVATIFYRLLTNDARDENWTTSNSFTDVSADSWYNTPVSTLSAMGLIEGYEDGSFRPDNPITRAEFAAIAGRFFTDNDAIYEPGTFSDIEGAEWFADAVQAAKDHDIIGGYPDGSFKPNNPITRAEACSIVNRTTKRVPDADHLLALDEMRNWPDNADTSAWYYADMQEATNGHYYDYVLDENDEIVREEWTSERAPIDWEQLEEELEASH